MQHSIANEKAGPRAAEMIRAVESCVHCGFCLSTCPTYVILGEEMNSPRGRIILMKEALEGKLKAEEVKPYIDCCLGCLACETSCPSGVRYGELVSPYRFWSEPQRSRSIMDQLRRKILLFTVPNPGRFRLAVLAGRLARPFQRLIPAAFRPMLDLVPVKLPPAYPMSETYPAEGQRRARVALLSGCAQQVLAPEINKAMLRVLAANGVEVVVPRKQACCGALALHVGSEAEARASARQNLSAFPNDVDAILTNASGCGSGIHEYGLLFKGEPEEEKAKAFALRTLDICTFLDRLGLIRTPAANRRIRVAYHDACHLAHAQKERLAPRRILRSVEGIELVEPSEWELCCGSAGTYNLEQPEIARSLGRRKAENLFSTGAEWIATGNIGCLTQIKAHLRLIGRVIPIVHTVEILSRAYDRKLQ